MTTDISTENPKKSPPCWIPSPFTSCALFMTEIENAVEGIGLGRAGGVRVTLLYAARLESQLVVAVAEAAPVCVAAPETTVAPSWL